MPVLSTGMLASEPVISLIRCSAGRGSQPTSAPFVTVPAAVAVRGAGDARVRGAGDARDAAAAAGGAGTGGPPAPPALLLDRRRCERRSLVCCFVVSCGATGGRAGPVPAARCWSAVGGGGGLR